MNIAVNKCFQLNAARVSGLILFWLILVWFSAPVAAQIRLPHLVSDKMVLQRDTELNIWGWAGSGEKVTVRFRGNYYNTEPDADGKWSVALPPQQAGGPFLMEINEIVIRDVLVGDVWLCSGQSNQETPIARLTDMFPEINVSNNHMIRHYKVPTQNSVESLCENILGGARWYSGTASEVMNWTALAYFFAQEAYEKYRIPIGMLVSSLGGSAIESWISQEHLKEFPERVLDQSAIDSMKIESRDKGTGKWAAPKLDDSDWQTIQIPSRWNDNGIDLKGSMWYRKEVEIPSSMDRKHAKLILGVLVDSDSVFVNGRFVGSTPYQYPPRKYDIPAGILHRGKNMITVKLTAPMGNGEFVVGKEYKIKGDDTEIDLTGEWKYKVGMDLNKVKIYVDRLKNRKTAGSGLYNGMIYPIRDYKVKGAIWYQGESNAGSPGNYAILLEALIANWRKTLNMPQMPFLLVQLPNFMNKREQPSGSGWAGIREAQLQIARKVPHTALAVTYDVGEWNDIHPLNKKDVAHRLFLGARRIAYGEKIVSSGPLYKDMEIKGNKVIITFTETGKGLTSNGEQLHHFAIAGADKKFVWADAVISSNKVIVSSKEVEKPVAVRYAWSDNPEDANLRNKEGLLASPFRTDEW